MSFTAAVEQFSQMELEFERLEFHKSIFEDGEGEKEKKRGKEDLDQKKKKKTTWRKLDLKKKIWRWRTQMI